MRAHQPKPDKAKSAPEPSVQRKKAESSALPAWAGALPLQTKLTVNQPGDAYEQEADAVAEQVMRAPLMVQRCACGRPAGDDGECASCKAQRMMLQRSSDGVGGSEAPPSVHETLSRSGQPLEPTTRSSMESRFGQDFSGVRVHTDSQAARSAADMNARAYTVGQKVVFGAGQYAPATAGGRYLIAHELVHTVQQRGTADYVQRGLLGDLWDSTKQTAGAVVDTVADAGSSVVDTVSDVAGAAVDAVANVGWAAFEAVAPNELVQIARDIQAHGGIFDYLEALLRNTFSTILDNLRADPGLIGQLTEVFVGLFGRAQIILEALKQGNCGPLFAAMDELKAVVTQLAGEAWQGIKDFFTPIGDFFSGLWQKFGAPIIEWLTTVASDVWEKIKGFGAKIWSLTEPIRNRISAIWTWFKELLFGQDNPQTGESEGGFVEWIKQQAADAWEAIKQELEPVIAPIRAFAEKIMSFIPLDKILQLRDTIVRWTDQIQLMTQNMAQPNDVAANQISLRDEILPAVLLRIQDLRDGLVNVGVWIAGNIGEIAAAATSFLDSLRANSLLSPLVGTLDWLQEAINGMTTWAQANVTDLFALIGDGLVYLSQFIRPILDTLQQLVDLLSDLVGNFATFIQGAWNRIPACIREPIENFIKDYILANIPIFAQLMQIPDVWEKLTGAVKTILKQIFVDGDLLGAAWTFFRTVLYVLDIPEDLVLNIISKAAQSLGDILKDPIKFIINLIKSIKQGFSNFVDNLAKNLLQGFGAWLSGELGKANIAPLTDFSLKSVITWVLDVLGVSVENVFDRMSKHPRIGPERTRKIRRAFEFATGAIRWIYKLVTEGPAAVWEDIKEQLSNLWSGIMGGIITWLTEEVAKKALLKLISSFADPTGIMAAVNTVMLIYDTIKSVIQYMRQILETVNTVLNGIAEMIAGDIGKAAEWVERGLVRIIPIAIGFLLNILGLDGAGDAIRKAVEKVREVVNKAIDWLINKSIQLIDELLGKKEDKKEEGNEDELKFMVGNKWHRIFMEGDEIMINPTPKRPLNEELNYYTEDVITASLPEPSEREEVKKEINKVRKLLGEAKQLRKLSPEMQTHMISIYTFLGQTDTPATDIEFTARGNWTSATAETLTLKPPKDIKGSKRTSAGKKEDGWTIAKRLNQKNDIWVNAHLIHFNLHGPNDPRNFAIADKTANANMYTNVEEPTISALSDPDNEGNLVLSYKTTVTYYDDDYSDFAKKITTRVKYKSGKKKFKEIEKTFLSTDPAEEAKKKK
jgi:hypothetical protein